LVQRGSGARFDGYVFEQKLCKTGPPKLSYRKYSTNSEEFMICYKHCCQWWLLTASLLCGCAGGPLPQKAAWPWQYGHGKDYGKDPTGDFVSIRGNVASFGNAPKALEPVRLDAPPAPGAAVPGQQPSVLPAEAPRLVNTETKPKRAAAFMVRDVTIEQPAYLPTNARRAGSDITAFNHFQAPVSVAIGINPASAQNIAHDKSLPLSAVVPPDAQQVLVRIRPKNTHDVYNYSYSYSWSIGDYRAQHQCPEHYRFPFGANVQAFAYVSDPATTSAASRYAVLFSMPLNTPIRAARNGRVVQIKSDSIDILHNDTTIATYGHLGTIADTMHLGKAITTEDSIGIVGSSGDGKEGYLQLRVWRPEPLPMSASNGDAPNLGFDFASFPLTFCTADADDCRVITHDQKVASTKTAGAQKETKRKGNRKIGTLR
jgi:murein DD-endopeptidase MepM/ murein hydrolase activator NlpD